MELTPRTLLYAYCDGIFPMGEEDQIHWYAPDPRAILPLDQFHVPRRLQRTVKMNKFDVRFNHDFAAVMRACAEPAPDRDGSWITEPIIDIYCQLHELGFAHSVEAWQDNMLVGGLYGVSINSFFAGESMFARQRDASKVALVHLVNQLRTRKFQLLDVQFQTPHLNRFGVVEIPRSRYMALLAEALQQENQFIE